MNKINKQIYQYEYLEKMKEIISKSSEIKSEIFKSNISENNINYGNIKSYINFINDFLKFWEDYGKETQEKMCKIKASKGVNNYKYQDIKEYIYGNYDYAAIIPFIDSLYKGINNEIDGQNMEIEDIEDYFKVTISKAFDDQPQSVSELMNSVLPDSMIHSNRAIVDDYEAKLFDSVKSYNKMFNNSDRIVLNKAIQKYMDFISYQFSKFIVMKNNVKKYIASINYAIEMITYSLVAYASRVFIICDYGYAFINASMSNYHESTDEIPVNNHIKIEDINVMLTTNDNIFKDINEINEAWKVVDKFISIIGRGSENLHADNSYYNYESMISNNRFINKLKESNNLLFILLDDYRSMEVNGNRLKCIEENIQKLKSILYNNKQSNSSYSSSPLQEYLHILRGIGSKISTQKECKDTILDLTKLFMFLTKKIYGLVDRIDSVTRYDLSSVSMSINDTKNITEYRKLLSELYSNVIPPILNLFRDLEVIYNNINKSETDKHMQIVSLTDPTNIVKSVPDTLRLPINLMDLYSLPAFESYSMYDDYLRTLPEFENDLYLSEAFNMSEIINRIMSVVNSSWGNLLNWFNNKSVKAAMKWIKDNEQDIRKTDLTPAIGMKSFPYPSIRNNKSIDLEKGTKNLFANIKNYKPDDPNFDANKFIASLYPNETVQKWFNDKSGAQKYWTWIIANCGENEVGDGKALEEVTLNEGNINVLMKDCLDNCINIDKIFSSLNNKKNQFDQEINNLKQKTVKASSTIQQSQNSVGNISSDKNEDEKDNKTQSSSSQSQNKSNEQNKDSNNIEGNNNASNINNILTQINLAVIRLWIPIPKIVAKVITDQYQHIKAAYIASQNNNQN